jgi:hypothetical protein
MNRPDTNDAQPTIMALIGQRLRLTEGQLYTLIVCALIVVLLSLTGLPTAHKRQGGGLLPVPTQTPTTAGANR